MTVRECLCREVCKSAKRKGAPAEIAFAVALDHFTPPTTHVDAVRGHEPSVKKLKKEQRRQIYAAGIDDYRAQLRAHTQAVGMGVIAAWFLMAIAGAIFEAIIKALISKYWERGGSQRFALAIGGAE